MLTAVPKPGGATIPFFSPGGFAIQQARAPDGSFEFRSLTPGTYIVQNMPGGNFNGNPVTPLTGRLEVTISDANVDGVVPGLALDTADFPLDGRGVLPLGDDDLLRL